jgi:DNA-binding NtrC family response regulator
MPDAARMEWRDPNALSMTDETGDMRPLEMIEAEVIKHAIRHYRGHMTEVSKKLKIGRSTLYRKLKDYGLDDGKGPEAVDDAA